MFRKRAIQGFLAVGATCFFWILLSTHEDCAAKQLEIPKNGAYTGAYVDFGEGEDELTVEALEKFEKLVGKHQAIIACGAFWGEPTEFPIRLIRIIDRYGAVPLLFWSPWDKPYTEMKKPDRFNLNSIVKGAWDAYIDRWAENARAWGKPLLVSWGLEMNGTWFPWSGYFYNKPIKKGEKPEPHAEGPELYKAAYRHVVDRVRNKGASNIQWIFHVNHSPLPIAKWNKFAAYYPGDAYVDWLGMSVYGMIFWDQGWTAFDPIYLDAYRELAALNPIKPIIIAEWGVGEFPASGDKAAFIQQAFDTMKLQSPRVKAAVYWHERWQNEDGSYSNLRISSSPAALETYRKNVAQDYWIGYPIFTP
ncbi:glycoside hydrolase family 26 protein [Desulfatirhabdium butyrativorans]|uniref:glycoside hydrolase family 26 protein n=1 Tax=Desulfatirhabdium butyrativorans TaxID=340467 RepID=UPI00146FB8DC|nr:glycosyl hydrolase [Desulfatirhabdium butyrativorans]